LAEILVDYMSAFGQPQLCFSMTDRRRYICRTGHHIKQSPNEIHDCIPCPSASSCPLQLVGEKEFRRFHKKEPFTGQIDAESQPFPPQPSLPQPSAPEPSAPQPSPSPVPPPLLPVVTPEQQGTVYSYFFVLISVLAILAEVRSAPATYIQT
jgi:hypothetical protein